MLGFLLRRLILGALVLVTLSLASYCFFTWTRQGGSLSDVLHAWWTWTKGVDGGDSYHVLTSPVLVAAFWHTGVLLGLTIVIVVGLSVGLALVAAGRRGSLLDVALRTLSYAGWAVPAFLLALLVQLLVNTVGGARGVGPFPLAGWPGTCPTGIGLNSGYLTPCPAAGHGGRLVLNVLRYATLPSLTLAVGFVGLHARYLRSALLENLAAPYITTARAKGLSERRVLVRHALRASLSTFVAALFSDFASVLGSALAVDWIFKLNGLGTFFLGLFPRTFGTVDPNLMTPVLVLAAIYVLVASVLGDLAVVWLDPRARGEA